MNKYVCIGKIYKNSIFKNYWIAYIKNIPLFKEDTKFIFIKINGIITPFFIDYYKKINKNKFLLNFDNSAKEENFFGRYLYRIDKIKKLKNNKINNNYYNLISYKAIDINKGYLGFIFNINDKLPQFLFEIKYYNNNSSTILVPIVNALIKNINISEKIVLFDLPEGLIDIYI